MPATIEDAAWALRRGEVSSVALTRDALNRIEHLNQRLGAFATVRGESAMAAAAKADRDFASGTDRGPLQGIPIGIKDVLATLDMPTRASSRVLDPSWGDGWDAPAVARLRAGGAVILGKTTVSGEFYVGDDEPNEDGAIPRNPWNLAHSAAGSSSGMAIAVATGMTLGGLGSDSGGSVRFPAAVNGITGLKVTYGRVPTTGCVPLGPSLDTVGPMARSAKGCALLLAAIAGPDPSDRTSSLAPTADYVKALTGKVRGLRIGVPERYFFDSPDLDPELKSSIHDAIDVLVSRGAVTCPVIIPDPDLAAAAVNVLWQCESFAHHLADLQHRWTTFSPSARIMLVRGALLDSSDYIQAQRFRTHFTKSIRAAMAGVDVLATPPISSPAQLLGGADVTAEGRFMSMWNLTGQPALAVPCGFSSRGLPLSMQLVGRPFDEETLLRVADTYQQLTNWHLQTPPIVGALDQQNGGS